MPVVWDERHRGHAPGAGIWLGVSVPGDEEPERGDALGDALRNAGAELQPATDHGDEPLLRVHTPGSSRISSRRTGAGSRRGTSKIPASRSSCPTCSRLPHVTSARPGRQPAAIRALAGLYAMDTMTLIGPGTYARGTRRRRRRAHRVRRSCSAARVPRTPRCVRPATTSAPTSTAVPATSTTPRSRPQYLRDRGVERVAIIDVDAHHGNGTQEIFYARGDVFYGSAHVDPGQGWFPHFVGFADEAEPATVVGSNRNLPLPEGAGDETWLGAVEALVAEATQWHADALVVSLGVDGAAADPEQPVRAHARRVRRNR